MNFFNKLLQRLSGSSEFVLVISLTFGYFIFQSFYTYIEPGNAATSMVTEDDLMQIVVFEIILGLLVLYILRARGWSRDHLHLRVSRVETAQGLLLMIADKFALVIAIIFIGALFGNALFIGNEVAIGTIQPGVVVIFSLVKALYEEGFVVSYVVQTLEKRHDPFFVVSVSAIIRLLYHTDQGPVAILILPMGLLHAYVFWRWRRLWPLVVAHAVIIFGILI